jgi:hypothetical protein
MTTVEKTAGSLLRQFPELNRLSAKCEWAEGCDKDTDAEIEMTEMDDEKKVFIFYFCREHAFDYLEGCRDYPSVKKVQLTIREI